MVETSDASGTTAEHGPEGRASFWAQVRRRIIVTSTMDRDVRLAFASGSAIIALVMMVHLFRRNLGPAVPTPVGTVPIGAVALLALGEFVVFLLLFLGLFRISRWRRHAALGVAAAVLALSLILNGALVSGSLLFLPLALAAVLGEAAAYRRWSVRVKLLLAVAVAVATMFIFIYFIAIGAQSLIISFIGLQAIVAMIGLLMSATDIAEMVTLAAEAGVSSFGMFSSNRLMAVEAVALAVGSFAVSLLHTAVSADSMAVALGGGLGLSLWVGILYWLLTGTGKKLGNIEPELSYRTLLLIVCVYFLGMMAGLLQRLIEDPKTYDPGQLFYYTSAFEIPFLLFLAFLAIFLIVGRRSARTFVWSGFACCVGMTWFLYYSSHGDDLTGLQQAIAIGSVIYLGAARLIRPMRARFRMLCAIVAELNLCFIVYVLLVSLFFATKGAGGEFSFWQAFIVLAALVWDILSSGQAITNQHNDAFPRISRVSFFLAYTVSVALLVLVSSSSSLISPANGAAVEGVFEPEPLVAVGLMLFGPPFFMLVFMLRARASAVATPIY